VAVRPRYASGFLRNAGEDLLGRGRRLGNEGRLQNDKAAPGRRRAARSWSDIVIHGRTKMRNRIASAALALTAATVMTLGTAAPAFADDHFHG